MRFLREKSTFSKDDNLRVWSSDFGEGYAN